MKSFENSHALSKCLADVPTQWDEILVARTGIHVAHVWITCQLMGGQTLGYDCLARLLATC